MPPMKKTFFLILSLLSLPSAWAQATYTVTATPSTYASGGGQVLLNVTLSYPTNAVPSLAAKPPANTWAYVSATGTNVPTVQPRLNDTTDPTDPNSTLGFTYTDPPATSAAFSFVVSYPAGLTGDQVMTFSGAYRLDGVLTTVTVPAITLTLATSSSIPAITLQPASASASAGANAFFAGAASGVPSPTFQWQRSTDGGSNWSNLSNDATYSGVTATTLTVNAVAVSMNGHRFRFTATNTQGAATSNGLAALVVTQAPTITQQPVSQVVLAGSPASFSVVASGSGTLTYQWFFTPKNSTTPQTIAGANAASYALANVQAANEGDYVCVVDNGAAPAATSSAAQLSVAARLVRVVSQSASSGTNAVVPVQLLATGAENAVGFTLNFDPTQLTFVSAVLGAQAADASLNTNSGQIAAGKLGIALAKPTNTTWTAGTQEIVKITFTVNASLAGGTVSALTYSDSPILREISDAAANALPGGFQGGNVTVPSGFEADMNGNGVVSITDWVKVGRIVAGLDTVANGIDFQKADCAGRSTLGNGVLSISDWVQAGRYAAGLDPLTPAGGPTAPNP